MDTQLKGKVALVTGGSRGIGTAICKALAEEGMKVGINYRSSQEEAVALAKIINETYNEERAIILPGDMGKSEDISPLFSALDEKWGGADILVNNAAYCPSGP
ncbi:MAG: SDR family NAD(P)-dependent oxidoreductase, partial [Planctomycetes bacterium]|nr:SDR family NAD(P)-dependent oxidoreductase [Planctomycetota bacterium]